MKGLFLMSEPAVITQEKTKPDNIPSVWFYVFFLGTADILEKTVNFPLALGMAIGMIIGSLVEYRVARPSIGFAAWIKRYCLGAVTFAVGFWLGPKILGHWIWLPLAYTISVFSAFMFWYWLNAIRLTEPV